jgi:flagellar motor switch protein FliN/FliY
MNEPNVSLAWPVQQWIEHLTLILASMTDQRPENIAQPSSPPDLVDTLAWQQNLSLIDGPACWIVAPQKTWFDIGSRTLRSAGLEQVEAPDARNTFFEIVNQSLSGVCQALGKRLQREVTCGAGCEITELPPAVEWVSVQLIFQGDDMPPLYLAVSAGLLDAIAETPTPELDASPARLEESVQIASSASVSKTFNLLLEVALPVSVSFGRSRMQVKDVLKLTTGSIVELDRVVDDPVEVIVNNRVIARGDVVVVDGNYGVRIRQIASRQDRLGAGSRSLQPLWSKDDASGQSTT